MRAPSPRAAVAAASVALLVALLCARPCESARLPLVINTWPFTNATEEAWSSLTSGGSRLDAVVVGCGKCECDRTVGFGGSPDDTGETTLDSMIMDGPTHRIGAVASLRRIKNAVGVARAVMEHTDHTMLAGDGATRFAKMMGFKEENLTTEESGKMHSDWLNAKCQPNYYERVANKTTQCPPFRPEFVAELPPSSAHESLTTRENHDTIGMIVVDAGGDLASATSTNGAKHKIAGRVGDSPIPGSGSYVDNDVGGAAGTGDGDIMMRFAPAFHAVQLMSQGVSVKEACERPLREIARYYPDFKGSMVCVSKSGEYAGSAHGWEFSFSVRTPETGGVRVVPVTPIGGV